jgi:peptidoglycan/LPS O-acetylase OafA/YrhL
LHLGLLGGISYSFYLIHQLILMLSRMIWAKAGLGVLPHPLIVFLTCLAWYPVIFLVSCAMYRWIEKPSIGLGKALWNGVTRRAVP